MRGYPKSHCFKSFTGLTVQEFDDIYDNEITKRYGKYELKRLSKRKYRKRKRYRCCWKTIQTRPREQVPYAFGVLSSLHYLHFGGFSL
jgi:hypothetical protein